MSALQLVADHKQGLLLPNPVLLACGVAGYGDAMLSGLTLEGLGGFVTAPVTRRPWKGRPPRLVEVPGGTLWCRGPWNPGVRRIVNDYGGLWRRCPVPVFVHVAGRDPAEMAAVAAHLETVDGVAGLEVDVEANAEEAAAIVWSLRNASELPITVRLPLHAPDDTVAAVVQAGAHVLVLARPPIGLCHLPDGEALRGGLHGPGLVSLISARLADLATWVDRPLVACGGIHSLEDALEYLAAGARAVQVDLAAWVDPTLPASLAAALAP